MQQIKEKRALALNQLQLHNYNLKRAEVAETAAVVEEMEEKKEEARKQAAEALEEAENCLKNVIAFNKMAVALIQQMHAEKHNDSCKTRNAICNNHFYY